jgi:hypothetical protein
MNSKIEPHYVDFNTAKLLKEKEFKENCNRFYTKSNSKMFGIDEHGRYYPIKNTPKKLYTIGEHVALSVKNVYSAPEQWQVVEWLLQNHRLDIIIKYPESKTNKVEGINSVYYDLEIYKLQGGDAHKLYKFIGISDKKQEAYSAAFDYILNYLI